MRRFVWSQFRVRRSRTGALALAILVAAVSFTLLTASAKTSSLHVHGTLRSSFRPAYDILVRPSGSQTRLERRERLVRPNFLSGVFGGISFQQWHKIQRIHSVVAAAPIANIGYILPHAKVRIPITDLVDDAPYQLYRIKETWVANGGLSRYPGPSYYAYYTPRDRFVSRGDYVPVEEVGPEARPPQPSCSGFSQSGPRQPASPFPPLASLSYLTCFPTSTWRTRYGAVISVNSFLPPNPGFVGTESAYYLPVYISAIDPVQEAKLVHLNRTLVNGRYLRPNEGLSSLRGAGTGVRFKVVPVLASSRTYVDERLEVAVQRLHIPPGTNVPRALASGTCPRNVIPCPNPLRPPRGARYSDARQFVEGLPGTTIARRAILAAASVYRDLLRNSAGKRSSELSPEAYWTTSPALYRTVGPDRLAPIPQRNPRFVWRSSFSNYITPPLDNRDTQFRRLHGRVASNLVTAGAAEFSPLRVVGQFDPEKLPSYSPLSKVPLETYYPPELLPGNEIAKRALHGRPLSPNQNLGDYIQQPPLLLTSLRALRAFLIPKNWARSDGGGTAIPKAQRLAPISAVRVKVAGVRGPDPLSLERIRVVAQKIHDETGLHVDITAGSSPHPVLISLPKGRFGRPPLLLQEGWSKKGVTVSFLRALDRKDLGLFALILVICALFLGNGALASVRARRVEIGTLLTFGWSRRAIFAAVLAELAVLGLAAGALGTGIAALLAATPDFHVALASTLLVLPIALALALAAGALPAWLAARASPLDALNPPVAIRRGARPVRRLATLALANLLRVPARTALGAGGLALGVAALAILLAIERAFQGTLVGTVLGSALSLQVHGADFVAVGLTIALAALSVADVLYLNLRERAAELVTLKTLGWSRGHVANVVLLEALGLGLAGSLAGALLGLLVGGAVLGVPLGPLVLTCLLAGAGGTTAALLASLVPLSRLGRLSAPAVLAAE